jgi:hypothetical protein
MYSEFKFAWAAIVGLCLIAATMFFSAIGHAEAPSLTERLIAVQTGLQSKTDAPVEPRELAEAITAVPKVTRDWAALLLTIAHHESALSARIAANDCNVKKRECDGGRAFGLYQAHKNKLNESVWGSSDIRVQTLEAARGLRSAFYTCNGKQPLRVDWVARTINAYAGRRCDAQWPGLDKRLATFNRVVRKL